MSRRQRAVDSLRECDLGPIIGQIEPMRPIRRTAYHQPNRWIGHGWQSFWGFIAVAVYLAFVVIYFWFLMVVLAKPARATEIDEAQIRSDCRWDALRYCKAAILTADRQVIIACMVENKDKLRPKCRRHMW